MSKCSLHEGVTIGSHGLDSSNCDGRHLDGALREVERVQRQRGRRAKLLRKELRRGANGEVAPCIGTHDRRKQRLRRRVLRQSERLVRTAWQAIVVKRGTFANLAT